MKNQVLFSLKDKSRKYKGSSAAIFVYGFKGKGKKFLETQNKSGRVFFPISPKESFILKNFHNLHNHKANPK